jgi:hypothetical protein
MMRVTTGGKFKIGRGSLILTDNTEEADVCAVRAVSKRPSGYIYNIEHMNSGIMEDIRDHDIRQMRHLGEFFTVRVKDGVVDFI